MCGPGAGRGSREVETGGPQVFRLPAVALHTSAGAGGLATTVSSWDGACWSERVSSESPLLSTTQRPPMTSASSSGTLGCPTTTTNSRPGEAGGWAGGGQGGQTPGSEASPPPPRRQPAAHPGCYVHPSAPLPRGLLPRCLPAGRLRGRLLLLGRAAGPAPEEEVRLAGEALNASLRAVQMPDPQHIRPGGGTQAPPHPEPPGAAAFRGLFMGLACPHLP